MAVRMPRLRLRDSDPLLLGLPWGAPLETWAAETATFHELPVGPSRHVVRFIAHDGGLVALKEEPGWIAEREYAVLRHLEEAGLPAVKPIGIAGGPEDDAAILVTRYLRNSLQYRLLLSRVPPGPGYLRDQLLDAMAGLLVELHGAGVYWGDCSLANTLFRRSGDKVQAYLVDAETSEIHPGLSEGQRIYDLEVLVENVGFGLADLAAMQGRSEDLMDDALAAAESVRDRYFALWNELHSEVEVGEDERFAVAARIRRLNELGFAVDELEVEPGPTGRIRVRVAVTNRRFHARELERLTGLRALEGQARLLLNDLREYGVWLERHERRSIPAAEAARRWLADVLQPTLARLALVVGPGGDAIQAYCDVLETKWLRSEAAGLDIGLAAATEAYLEAGAPGPEITGTLGGVS